MKDKLTKELTAFIDSNSHYTAKINEAGEIIVKDSELENFFGFSVLLSRIETFRRNRQTMFGTIIETTMWMNVVNEEMILHLSIWGI